MGKSWNLFSLVKYSNATYLLDINSMVGSMGKGPVISTSGASGPFLPTISFGLAAMAANKIAQKQRVLYY